MIPTEPIAVTGDRELAELCRSWRQQGAVAVDTEFMRSSTFYPIAGLIQVGDGKGCYLIDPLAIKDFSPLRELMQDENVTKVLHACSEDLEVFDRLLGTVPSPLFDTQLAAAFCGYPFSLSYAGLAMEVLGIDVPKGETRSDWLQRPLSLSQQKYAALDVAHLLIIYGKLLQQLKADERWQWVKDDCAQLVDQARRGVDPDSFYLKIGSAWKLRERELAVLQKLCRWREIEARARDLPRNRLLKEAVLWELARRLPDNHKALRQVPGISGRTVEEDGSALLAIIAEALASDPMAWPAALPPPLRREQSALLKKFKGYVRSRAQSLGLPPEVLARKKEYEAMVRAVYDGQDTILPNRLAQGWRYSVVGEGLLACAAEFNAGEQA